VNNGRLTVYSPQDLGGGNQGIFLRNGSVVQMVGTYSIANKISIDTIGGGVDVPTGSSITLTAGDSPTLGNYQSVFRKTGDGVLTLGNYARETGEFSIEGGTVVADSIYRFGWGGTIITLTNNATLKKRAILNHGEGDYMLNVAGTGGRVDLDGESATLNAVDFLNGNGTLVVMNSGAGSPTLNINYQQSTFTGVLDVQLGSTTFYGADMPNGVLRLGPSMTWSALNAVTKLGGLSGSGTFNYGGNTVLFGGMGDSEFFGLLKGSGAIVKQGTGTWSLSSSDLSQFTGTLAISNGTFAANSVITRPVTLAGSGTLGGTGTVTQVTMSGGRLAPANDGTVGRLTIGSSLSLDGALSVDVREDGSSDCLQVSGDLTLSATSSLVVVDTNRLMRVGSYVIATWSGTRSGTIPIFDLPPFWSIQYNDASKKMILQGPPQGTLIRVM
jgi:autotransporter-associated beta strand protein